MFVSFSFLNILVCLPAVTKERSRVRTVPQQFLILLNSSKIKFLTREASLVDDRFHVMLRRMSFQRHGRSYDSRLKSQVEGR